jgi:hypothetical protein
MTDAKKPMAEANRISTMLSMVLGADRFPVKVDELAWSIPASAFQTRRSTRSRARIWTVSMVC